MTKLKLVAALLLGLLIGAAAAVLAQQYITSRTVTVTVENIVLTLEVNASTCVKGDTIKFTGTLASPTFTYEGVNVTLYKDDVQTGNWDLTDVDGNYEILYVTVENGTFSFYTKAPIT